MSNPLSKLPTADQARQHIGQKLGEQSSAEAEMIRAKIQQAIDQNRTDVGIHPPIKFFSNRTELQRLGYKVKDVPSGPNETSTDVSW